MTAGSGWVGGSRPVTPGTVSENPYVEVVQAGIDDITLGFEMEGSRHIGDVMKLAEMGRPTRYGQVRLGHEESFGKFRDLVPRQYTTWSPKGRRVYVQAKLAPGGVLTPLDELERRVGSLVERMALFGIMSYEEPFVTRLDVTVDGRFSGPAEGKAFLDSLLGIRLPGRMVARPYGVPMTTVYHQLASGKVRARSYCRSTKTGERGAVHRDPARAAEAVESGRASSADAYARRREAGLGRALPVSRSCGWRSGHRRRGWNGAAVGAAR
jgi:hypothetical protein